MKNLFTVKSSDCSILLSRLQTSKAYSRIVGPRKLWLNSADNSLRRRRDVAVSLPVGRSAACYRIRRDSCSSSSSSRDEDAGMGGTDWCWSGCDQYRRMTSPRAAAAAARCAFVTGVAWKWTAPIRAAPNRSPSWGFGAVCSPLLRPDSWKTGQRRRRSICVAQSGRGTTDNRYTAPLFSLPKFGGGENWGRELGGPVSSSLAGGDGPIVVGYDCILELRRRDVIAIRDVTDDQMRFAGTHLCTQRIFNSPATVAGN